MISSRTPDGEPARCPVCGHEVTVSPSRPPGDAPCPYCGSLLWFRARPQRLLFDPTSVMRAGATLSLIGVAGVVLGVFAQFEVGELLIVGVVAALLFGDYVVRFVRGSRTARND